MALRASLTKKEQAKVIQKQCLFISCELLATHSLISLLLKKSVVQSWAQSKSSDPPCSMQSFPATNRQALKSGCLTAKAQREYSQKFPVMKQNPRQKQSNKKSHSNSEEDLQRNGKIGEVITSIYQESNQPDQPPQTFGIQSKKNKVSMTELLRGKLDNDETDYPNLSSKKRKGRLPPAKATKSSLIVAKCREPPSADEMARRMSIEEFKLKKFLKVQPKVKCYM